MSDTIKLGYAVKAVRFSMPKDEDYSITFQSVSGRWRALATLEDPMVDVWPIWSSDWFDEPDEAHQNLIGEIRRSANVAK